MSQSQAKMSEIQYDLFFISGLVPLLSQVHKTNKGELSWALGKTRINFVSKPKKKNCSEVKLKLAEVFPVWYLHFFDPWFSTQLRQIGLINIGYNNNMRAMDDNQKANQFDYTNYE